MAGESARRPQAQAVTGPGPGPGTVVYLKPWRRPNPGRDVPETRPGDEQSARAVQETSVDMAGLVNRAARAEGELVGLREALARADAALARVEVALARADATLTLERSRGDRLAAELALARRGWLVRLLEAVRRR
jgi:hypothetical protein